MSDWSIIDFLSKNGIDFEPEGSNNKVHGFSSIDRATDNDLAFCWYVGEKGAAYISRSNAGVIICKKEMRGVVHPNNGQLLVFTDNPRLTFVRASKEMM